jgi:alanine dehydrogenase
MLVLSAEQIRARVRMPHLIECLRNAFRNECVLPPRQVTRVPGASGERLFLSMQAFDHNGGGVAKLATVFPDNQSHGLPTIQAVIVVFSPNGTPLAVLDGSIVTQLRTGAASALASTYLSRLDSSHLVVLGTGALAPYMAMAHCAARPIARIGVWGRRPESANAVAATIRALVDPHIEVLAVAPEALADAVRRADIVSCATASSTPVLAGKWLKAGAFVDLAGSFSPAKREADDAAVTRSRIFVDTLEGALSEAGDILDPLARGIIERGRIEGELADLVHGRARGRIADDEIILFKSVGTAIEDLAAAQLVIASASDLQLG